MNDSSDDALEGLRGAFDEEPFATRMGLSLVAVEPGRAVVEMEVPAEDVNLFGTAHGAALYSLADGAFEAAANSRGTVSVALSVTVAYVAPAFPGDRLRAEAVEVSRSGRISTFEIRVTKEGGALVAVLQAMAYNKKDPLPFLSRQEGGRQR